MEIGEVVTIAGVVHSYTEEEGNFGSYKRFKGEFALRHKGQNVMASTMFLPEIAADLLAAEVARGHPAKTDDAGPILALVMRLCEGSMGHTPTRGAP